MRHMALEVTKMSVRCPRPSQALLSTLAKLTVSPDTWLIGRKICQGGGTCEARYRQWVNEVIGSRGTLFYSSALKAPDRAFLSWLKQRAAQPYEAPHCGLSIAASRLGEAQAQIFTEIAWPALINAALTARLHTDDLTACLAGLWLQSVKADTLDIFKGILALIPKAHEQQEETPLARAASPEMANLFEPMNGLYQNLWRHHAEVMFLGVLSDAPLKIAALARQSRREAKRKRDLTLQRQKAERLRRSPPSQSLAVLGSLLRKGLDIEAIYAAEQSFIQEVEACKIPINAKSDGIQEYLKYATLAVEAIPLLTPVETERRRRAIGMISYQWARALPISLRQIGAAKKSNFEQWLQSATADPLRPPPEPRLSYAVWLLKRRMPEGVQPRQNRAPKSAQLDLFTH